MKKKLSDYLADAFMFFFKPVGAIWMWSNVRAKVYNHGVNFKRKEPFVLLGNHVYLFDVVELALHWRNVPRIVASQLLMTMKPLNILLKYIARVIPKSKSEADVRTAKSLLRSVKMGYPIMIMPEGDTTFFGETGYIEYATAKLIKKLKIDVITGTFRGGYLSKPRWAVGKRRNRFTELHYRLLISKEELKEMSVDEVYKKLSEGLFNNDYEWQREHMHKFPGKRLAEGLTQIIYVCPECESVHTLITSGNDISCSSCNTKGYIDEYGFVQGFKYDNLKDWNEFQLNYTEQLKKTSFEATGKISTVELDNYKVHEVGDVIARYENEKLIISGTIDLNIDLDELAYPIVTMRRSFSFEYEGVYYLLKLDNYALSFLRVCHDKY